MKSWHLPLGPEPSGVMMLLLTLALLAGPTCRAQNVLGNKDGDYFYVRGEDQGELKGVRIFLSLLKFIKGMQLQFGNYWSEVYGSRSPKYREFLLQDGELVIKVDGTAKLCLTSLSFTTNKGHVATFGVRRGNSFNDSGGADKYLVTINGVYAPGLCIRGMGFKWGNIHDDNHGHDDNEERDGDDKGDDDDEQPRGVKEDSDQDNEDDEDDD
ncbi:prostatic spermine-binding protein-like, partial [Grammomys surdaster]|uniref:prostatic spermine-binding protein-like n=1 Tax=Grammomys surdaster TaxID=491861 RepID=UPI00109F976B